MLFLIVLVVTTFLSLLLCSFDGFRKKAWIAYVVSLGINVATTYVSFAYPDIKGFGAMFMVIMKQGLIAMALFIIVMYVGALKPDKQVVKLMKYRGELSILAVIFMLNHAIYYGYNLIHALPTWIQLTRGAMFLNIMVSLLSLWAWAICIPLFVTSFRIVRRKMKASDWKNLQRYAYMFYGLVYIHVFLAILARPGWQQYWFTLILYSAIFWVYGFLRLRKSAVKLSAKIEDKKALMLSKVNKAFAFMCILALFSMSQAVAWAAYLHHSEQKSVEAAQRAAEEMAGQEGEDQEGQGANENYYKDGTYEGEAKGYKSSVKVAVTIKNDKMVGVELISSGDDGPYVESSKAVLGRIVNANSTDVDTVSGATITSSAMINAVNQALEKAVNNE